MNIIKNFLFLSFILPSFLCAQILENGRATDTSPTPGEGNWMQNFFNDQSTDNFNQFKSQYSRLNPNEIKKIKFDNKIKLDVMKDGKTKNLVTTITSPNKLNQIN